MPLELASKNIQEAARHGGFRVASIRPVPGPYTINLKLTADPQRYIDCGMINVPESALTQASQFPGAKGNHEYRVLIKKVSYQVKRRVVLDVMVALRMEPVGSQTYYWLDADYSVTREQNASSTRAPAIKARDTIHFKNGEEATFKNAPTRCRDNDQLNMDVERWLSGADTDTSVSAGKMLSASN